MQSARYMIVDIRIYADQQNKTTMSEESGAVSNVSNIIGGVKLEVCAEIADK